MPLMGIHRFISKTWILFFSNILPRRIIDDNDETIGEDHISLAGTEMASQDINNITFIVKGCYGAVIYFLSRDFSYTYKFEIETEGGSMSKITKYSTVSGSLINLVVENDTSHVNIMKCKERRKLQIIWDHGHIHVRTIRNKEPNNAFLSVFDTDSLIGLEISSISSEENTSIEWIFGDNLTEPMEMETTTAITSSSGLYPSTSTNKDIIKTTTAVNGISTSKLLRVDTEEHTSTDSQTATTANIMTLATSTKLDNYPTSNKYTSMTSFSPGSSGSTVESTADDGVTPLCSCECQGYQDLPAKLRYIRQNLQINKVELSSTLRRKHSAPDSRASSRYLGYLGVCVIVGVCLCILLADITSVRNRHIRVKPVSKTGVV